MLVVRTILVAVLWVFVLALGGVSIAAKDSSESLKEQIEQERRALEELRHELEQKTQQAHEVEEKRESLMGSIQDLDDRLIVSRQQRYAVNRKLKRKDRELERISQELEDLQGRMLERRSSILARLRVQYKQGRLGYLKALLSADSPADLQRRFHYLSEISKREYGLLDSYRQDAEQMKEAELKRQQARDQMLSLKRKTDRKLREVRELKRQKKLFLAKVSREKDTLEQAIAGLRQTEARKDSLLEELEQRRRLASVPSPRPTTKMRGLKGSLPWPARGKVVSFFGRQKHPMFETYIERKGIEIRTSEGGVIRAVMDGTVAYADWLKGYGLVVILDHPNGFFSLYAHASKLLTKVGETVQAGEVIGETGSTGITAEDALYFELRDGADPVDPLQWLAKQP